MSSLMFVTIRILLYRFLSPSHERQSSEAFYHTGVTYPQSPDLFEVHLYIASQSLDLYHVIFKAILYLHSFLQSLKPLYILYSGHLVPMVYLVTLCSINYKIFTQYIYNLHKNIRVKFIP